MAADIGYRGHRRNRRDTGGHDVRRVRDREAPGSNPGPPTTFVFKVGNLMACLNSPEHRRITISWRTIAIPASVGDVAGASEFSWR